MIHPRAQTRGGDVTSRDVFECSIGTGWAWGKIWGSYKRDRKSPIEKKGITTPHTEGYCAMRDVS